MSSSSSSASSSSLTPPAFTPLPSASAFSPDLSSHFHSGYFHPLLRAWNSSVSSSPSCITSNDFIYPIFITDLDDDAKIPINSLPDQYRWGVNKLPELLTPLVELGLKCVILFGVTEKGEKDAVGSYATSPSAPVPRALKLLKYLYPQLLLMCDVCLCAYTHHGHCGVVHEEGKGGKEKDDNQTSNASCFSSSANFSTVTSSSRFTGFINNSASIHRLAELSVYYAECGCDIIAPSDMMDGRIGAIKAALLYRNLSSRVGIMSYSVKFSSCFYGPFRDAAGSGAKYGDRSSYQFPIATRGLASRAVERDIKEGADFIMVKPGAAYLDLIRECADQSTVPMAVYQVSGEYAMLWHGAKNGAFGLQEAVMEQTVAFKRAGAGIILTYFTPHLLGWLKERQDAERAKAAEQAKQAQENFNKIKQQK